MFLCSVTNKLHLTTFFIIAVVAFFSSQYSYRIETAHYYLLCKVYNREYSVDK